MRRLLTLSLLLLATKCFAVEAVTIVGPVQVRFGTAGSTPTVAISDGLWTPYSPNNIAYMLGRVGIGTSVPSTTLDVLGTFSLTTGTDRFEMGTQDAYGNHQFWIKGSQGVLRLGSAMADGDDADIDAKGIVIYAHSRDKYAYHKADQLGLYNELAGTTYFLANSTALSFTGIAVANGSVFSISTGTTKLFNVFGTSVALKVPLVFQDGTVQNTAATSGVAITSCAFFYSGSNIFSKSNSQTGSVTGTDNFAAGDYTINATNVSGSYNIGIGYTALRRITSGPGNVALGIFAGTNLTSGQNNIAIGQSVLESATDPGYTVAAGYEVAKNFTGAGAGDSGQFNTMFNYQPLYYMSSGDDNIAIGYRAGFGTPSMTGITGNILLGNQAGFSIQTGSKRNVMIGYQAGYSETGADKLYISSGPSTKPLIKGDFANPNVTVNGTFTVGVATGTYTILGSTVANTNCGVVGSYCGVLKMNDGSIHYFTIY